MQQMFSSQWPLHFSLWLYRVFLRAYPSELRQHYEQEMLQTFRACCQEELEQGGISHLLRFWGFIFCDLIKSIPLEHITKLRNYFMGNGERPMGIFALEVALRTDIGLKRPTNEDNMISFLPENAEVMHSKGALFVVADGMGGTHNGEIASAVAICAIQDAYYQSTNEDNTVALHDAVKYAHQCIYQINETQFQDKETLKQKGMGTTCVAAVLKDRQVYIANAGDSLAYLVRGDEVLQLAEDHAWVTQQVREGIMSREEALTHHGLNVITRCLGIEADLDIYVASYPLQEGDTLVLCTDGLHTQVSEREIRATVERYEPEESARRLIERAKEQGGPDNITAIVIHVAKEHLAA